MTITLVAIGGVFGAIFRWLISSLFVGGSFFYATSIVNIVGSFLLGLCYGQYQQNPAVLALVAIGFCGAFTTFSTFALDILRLNQEAPIQIIVTYIMANIGGAILACWLGLRLTQLSA